MRILLTGASSFTGYWFAKQLREAGHEVIAPLRASPAKYTGVRTERVARLSEMGVTMVPNCPFGSEPFLQILMGGADILCNHGARVENYRSLEFDVSQAVSENTHNARAVFQAAKAAGIKAVVHTGSVFEQDEGAGEVPLIAFSPYGLSKGLTHQVLRFWAGHLDLPLAKFVIPNPFGPYEESRFCAYLVQNWLQRKTPSVRTARNVRDNIHVSLLARAYAAYVERVCDARGPTKLAPSGYVESQGAFASRFAAQIGHRLGIETPLELPSQADSNEPYTRINTDLLDRWHLGWNESAAWDELAEYYRHRYCVRV